MPQHHYVRPKVSLASKLCLDSRLASRSVCLGQSRLLDKAQATEENNESLETENDSEGDEGANDTSDGLGDVAVVGRLGLGGARGSRVGSAASVGVAANLAPVLSVGNGELVHSSLEVVPAEGGLALAEQGVRLEAVGSSSAVGPEEADGEIVSRGLGGAGGDNLDDHGGGVVADAVELVVGGGQLGEAEEGHEGTVGTELDVEARRRLAVDNGLESGHDLAGEDRAGNGTDGLAAVECEVPLVGGGQVVEVGEGRVGEEVVRGDGGVVDCGDVDVVKD